ncbi:hypothetical protein K6W26_16610 [Burkholderia sp. AU42008]|uniref:hypothetical protein n=1 Tax=unclassified Burkholderia TaxID=2613784 RepID=UPI0015C64BCF|nr:MULTISPECIES: hypothetical protein [unclassified Burkholderia]MBR8237036.1 hypothetical protein [Burkholderia sp. AU32357]MBY4874683.1 hypothetical protein [Burkholderia sp. AU42008]
MSAAARRVVFAPAVIPLAKKTTLKNEPPMTIDEFCKHNNRARAFDPRQWPLSGK